MLCYVITDHPAARLPSRRPIWLKSPAEDMTTNSAWSAEWLSADVVNHSLMAVPGLLVTTFPVVCGQCSIASKRTRVAAQLISFAGNKQLTLNAAVERSR